MKELFLCSIVVICLPLLVKGKFVFDECSYLEKDENQSNGYYTYKGHPCCLCGKGTHWDGDCASTENMYETRCKPCEYNNITRTYQDFEPHQEKKCRVEQHCPVGFISVGGSALEEHRCECPEGFKKKEIFSNYHHCEEVIAEITTPTTIATVKTDEIDKAVDENRVVPPTATIENRTKKDEPDVAITPENHEKDQKIVDTGYPDPEINGEDQKIVVTVSPEVNFTPVPSTTAIYISNGDENQQDNMPTTIVIFFFSFFFLAILAFGMWGVYKKIRSYFAERVKSCPPEAVGVRYSPEDPEGSGSQHDDTTSSTAHSHSGKANNSVTTSKTEEGQPLLLWSTNTVSVDPSEEEGFVSGDIHIIIDDVKAGQQQGAAQEEDSDIISVVETPERDTPEPNEVRSLLQSANTEPGDPSVSDIREPNAIQSEITNDGSGDPSDHNFYLSEEVEIVFVDIDDVEAGRQQGVAQEDDSGTLSSVVVVVETPERYSELEMQNNKAGPIDSGNQNGVVRESSEVSSDYLGNTVHASNQQQLGTDFALQGSSLTQQADPRISLDHKKFRQIAMENIAAIINQKDRMLLSHFLIPKDADLDSINESHRGDGHAEIFRRVFIRGFQLNPNLSLYELRDKAVEWKLGYLKDEFEDQIKQLERRIAQ